MIPPPRLCREEDGVIASTLVSRAQACGAKATIRHLILRHYRRFGTFLAVGLVGVVVTTVGLILLREGAHLDVYVGGALAWQASIFVTFTLNALITWRGATLRSPGARFVAYQLVAMGGLGIYLSTLGVVHSLLHLHYAVASLTGSGAAAVWNYASNHTVTFARGAGSEVREAA